MKRLSKVAVIVLGLLAGTAAALWATGRGPFAEPAARPAEPADLSGATPGADPPRALGGEAAGAVTLEEFADFQCPPCARLHPELKKVEAEYGPRLRVVFRHLPLESIHDHATEAALAAEAAGRQGKFWAMRDLLFERQGEWAVIEPARPVFVGYARSLRLDTEQFERDMDAPETKARVEADSRRADTARVAGTPALFVEGRELAPAEMTAEGMRAAVEAALKRRASR
ncbi:MAG TPA: thioredoxin domain-containing protein [Pyrinomonadaceae bacterium]|jgi:protein-disulfide isomerase